MALTLLPPSAAIVLAGSDGSGGPRRCPSRAQYPPSMAEVKMARISGMPGIVLLVAAIGMALSLLSAGQASAALFTQCPPTGADTGCGILITVNPDNTITITAASSPSQPPYAPVEATLIGLVNNSNSSVASIPLS